jgi:hypothetical protein
MRNIFKFKFGRPEQENTDAEIVRRSYKPQKPMHIVPPKSPPRLFDEMNSSGLRALEQEVEGGRSIEEIRELLLEHRPELASEFERIVAPGRMGPREVVRTMRLREAAGRIGALNELDRLAATGRAAAFLPIPPHISDYILHSFNPELVLATEDHLPPHLEQMGIDSIDDLLPAEIAARFASVEALLVEGFIRKGSMLLRKNAVSAIQILGNEKLRLFIHAMPHLPHHLIFEPLTGNYEVTELL